jgi:hypothetical protein
MFKEIINPHQQLHMKDNLHQDRIWYKICVNCFYQYDK